MQFKGLNFELTATNSYFVTTGILPINYACIFFLSILHYVAKRIDLSVIGKTVYCVSLFLKKKVALDYTLYRTSSDFFDLTTCKRKGKKVVRVIKYES